MHKWKCTRCSSEDRPRGYQKPTICRACRSASANKTTYDKRCEVCDKKFEAKAVTAKYCPECREIKNREYQEKIVVKKAKIEGRYKKCLGCNEIKVVAFLTASYCIDCYHEFTAAKIEVEEGLPDNYFARYRNGKYVILQVVEEAENPQEMLVKLRRSKIIK